MITKKYSELGQIGLFYWLSKTHTKPEYEFSIDKYAQNSWELSMEAGHTISFEEAKRRYDEQYSILCDRFDLNGFTLRAEKIPVEYYKKESAKKQIELLKSLPNFHEYCFEIDWEN